MIHVLGLLARGGHGKTTVVNYLRETYGVRIVSLASPLKKIAAAAMGFSDRQLYGTQEEKEAVDEEGARDAKGRLLSARIFLQKLGTEGIREYLGSETFCEGLVHGIRRDYQTIGADPMASHGPNVVYGVDDMRFPNEASFICGLDKRPRVDGSNAIVPPMFGHVLKIVCSDAPPTGNDSHPSEAGVDLVEPRHVSGLVVSSRALGINHLIGEVERTLGLPEFAGLYGALRESKKRAGIR